MRITFLECFLYIWNIKTSLPSHKGIETSLKQLKKVIRRFKWNTIRSISEFNTNERMSRQNKFDDISFYIIHSSPET